MINIMLTSGQKTVVTLAVIRRQFNIRPRPEHAYSKFTYFERVWNMPYTYTHSLHVLITSTCIAISYT